MQPSPSQLLLSTTARPSRPFAARLIHHSSPSSALRSSSHSPQLAQPGSSQLISSTTAGPSQLVSLTRCMTAHDRLRAWDVNFFGSSNLAHKSCGIFVASWGFAHCIGTRLTWPGGRSTERTKSSSRGYSVERPAWYQSFVIFPT